jgi:hypothetical protein
MLTELGTDCAYLSHMNGNMRVGVDGRIKAPVTLCG